jgi:hypothetical protein
MDSDPCRIFCTILKIVTSFPLTYPNPAVIVRESH